MYVSAGTCTYKVTLLKCRHGFLSLPVTMRDHWGFLYGRP